VHFFIFPADFHFSGASAVISEPKSRLLGSPEHQTAWFSHFSAPRTGENSDFAVFQAMRGAPEHENREYESFSVNVKE
jgi:hypothetical protein